MGSSLGAADAGRDVRLDFFRGFALICIFIDHTPNDLLSWFTVGSVGVSDAAEVFVLVSGYTAGLVYGRAFDREGALRGAARVGRRIWQLYVAHIFLLVLFLAIVGRTAELFDSTHYVEEFGVYDFLDDPLLTFAGILTLRYQPVFMDILPLYIVLLALLPVALWGFARAPAAALAISAACWLAVQLDPTLNLPAEPWPDGRWPFNPLAWQALFVLGAWLGWRQTGSRIAWLRARWPVWVAALIAGAGCIVQFDAALHEYYGLTTAALAQAVTPYMSKTDLSLLRFANVLAIALLAVRLLAPRSRLFTGAFGFVFVVCGRHSLHIFCLGILLSVLAYLLGSEYLGSVALELAVSLTGIAIMVAVATMLERFDRAPGEPVPHG